MAERPAFVRSSILIEFRRLAIALGLDPLSLMQKAHISRRYLDDPELTLPMALVVDLLEITAYSSGIDDFGIRLAEMRGLPDLGPIMLVLREETSVRSALKSLTAMLHLHSDALYMSLDERGPLPIFLVDIMIASGIKCRQAAETSVAGATEILRWLHGSDWNPVQVCFRHARPSTTLRHEHFFRCPIEFTADFNGLVLDEVDLSRELPPSSPVFRRQVERIVHDLSRPFSEGYVRRVTQVATLLLPHGDASAANCARLLGTSTRTLHRNLGKGGTNFSSLLDQLRRNRATQILDDSDLALTEIADHLGFASLSAFSRWFSSAFGESPRNWRARRKG